ncbi:hypothetical protein ACIBL6_22820 [Streptomyces sp. NPDC050400]|uniref:hypothetical protein n=1 Tax=Streptomyces sp. NPDC050400 TaxID=3365610 RepID=UPI00379FD55C
MSHETTAPHAVTDQHPEAVERLTALTAALAVDLDRGVWTPGPLERTLTARLLLACAGDGHLTPVRVRDTLNDGSVALTYVNEGRLARLLAQLLEVTDRAVPDAAPVPDAAAAEADAARLLARVARDGVQDADGL